MFGGGGGYYSGDDITSGDGSCHRRGRVMHRAQGNSQCSMLMNAVQGERAMLAGARTRSLANIHQRPPHKLAKVQHDMGSTW